MSSQAAPEIKKPLIYQIGGYLHINASGPRPLLQAIDALQQRYGWVVSYEDPENAASTHAATPAAPQRRLRSYLSGSDADSVFSFQYDVGPDASLLPDETKLLTTLVEAFNNSNDAIRFELLKQASSYIVVGISVSTSGDKTVTRPILGTPIVMSKKLRELSEALAIISRELGQKGRISVSINIASNVSWKTQVVTGGHTMTARELLTEILNQVGSKLCWRLLYEPSTRSYELEVKQAAV